MSTKIEKLNVFSPKMCGINHVEITKSDAIEVLSSTEFKDQVTIKHGTPIESFPDNYLITISESSKDSVAKYCGYEFLINSFFIPSDKKMAQLLISIPVKAENCLSLVKS